MKKSNLIKLFSILLIGVMVIMFNTNVLAAENNAVDLTGTLTNTSNDTNTNNTNTNTNTNINTNTNNTNTNNTNTNKTNTNTNNSSIYNNTSLPSTGIEDSIPVAMLVVVFCISAVYAYKKIRDYRNI